MKAILNLLFNMKATVLNQYAATEPGEVVEEVTKSGHWETQQDDITGGIKRIWIEDTAIAEPAIRDIGTSWQVNINRFDIDCYVRGFPEVGFRSSANTTSYLNDQYEPFEALQMYFPGKYVLNRRQYVTNIRSRNDIVLWLEEETGHPTVFEVQGVTPTFDPFGRHISNLTVLKRAQIQ